MKLFNVFKKILFRNAFCGCFPSKEKDLSDNSDTSSETLTNQQQPKSQQKSKKSISSNNTSQSNNRNNKSTVTEKDAASASIIANFISQSDYNPQQLANFLSRSQTAQLKIARESSVEERTENTYIYIDSNKTDDDDPLPSTYQFFQHYFPLNQPHQQFHHSGNHCHGSSPLHNTYAHNPHIPYHQPSNGHSHQFFNQPFQHSNFPNPFIQRDILQAKESVFERLSKLGVRTDMPMSMEYINEKNQDTAFLQAHHIRNTNKKVSCKSLTFDARDDISMKNVTREIGVLKNALHPNLMGVRDIFCQHRDGYIFNIDMAMDRMHGSLEHMKDFGATENISFPEPCLWLILQEMTSGLNYLHNTLEHFHGDIKPANILLNEQGGQIKLSGFQYATPMSVRDTKQEGTLTYMAPERADVNRLSDHRSDSWSLGMTLYELMELRVPYPEWYEYSPDAKKLSQFIASRETPPKCSKFLSLQIHFILDSLLAVNEEDRISISELDMVLKNLVRDKKIKVWSKLTFEQNLKRLPL